MVPPDSDDSILIDIGQFFENLDRFEHRSIFAVPERPWLAIVRIGEYVREKTAGLSATGSLPAGLTPERLPDPSGRPAEEFLLVTRSLRLAEDLFFREGSIRIGRETVLEAGAMVKGPAWIGRSCEIRQGAYLRGNLLIGDLVVVGHATEVKNAVIMDRSVAGHFNYVGDSILGENVNLGAGTVLANLQFRTPAEKKEDRIEPIHLSLRATRFNCGLTKFGAILGDYIETGCNSVMSPGTLIGKNCWIYPNTTVPKEIYPPGHVIRGNVPLIVEPK